MWIYAPLLLSDKAETSRNNFVNPSSLRPSSVRVRPSSASSFILREPDLAGRDPPVQITVQSDERLALRVREEEGVGLDGGQVEALPPQPLLLPFERAWNGDDIGFPLSDDGDISVADKRNDKRLLQILY